MKHLNQDEELLYIAANKDLREADVNAPEHFFNYGQYEFRNAYESDFFLIEKEKAAKLLSMQMKIEIRSLPWFQFLKFLIVPKLKLGINDSNYKSFLSLYLPDIARINSKNIIFVQHRSKLGNYLLHLDSISIKRVGLGSKNNCANHKKSEVRYFFDELNQKLIFESAYHEK
jgi:hypothetical protein